MSQLWHYTRHGQQRGPVSTDELRQLVEAGELDSADLVWTQGMTAWVALGSVEELRPRRAEACAITATPPRPLPAAPTIFESETPEYAETVPVVRRASATVSGNRVPVVLIAIGVSLVSFLAAFLFTRSQTTPLEGTYNWSLGTNRHQTWEIQFLEGHRVRLAVKSDGVSDMDLYVYLGDTLVDRDEGFSSDCQLSFLVRKTATYRVKVWNRLLIPDPDHRNGHNNGVLTYRQIDEVGTRRQAKAKDEPMAPPKEEAPQQVAQEAPNAPPPPQPPRFAAPAPPNNEIRAVERPAAPRTLRLPPKLSVPKLAPPPPAAPLVVDLVIEDDLPKKLGSKKLHSVDLQANVRYVIDLESDAFDTFLQLNNRQGRRLAFNFGNGNKNSQIVFQATETATHQLLVRAFASNGSGPYRITVSRTQD